MTPREKEPPYGQHSMFKTLRALQWIITCASLLNYNLHEPVQQLAWRYGNGLKLLLDHAKVSVKEGANCAR